MGSRFEYAYDANGNRIGENRIFGENQDNFVYEYENMNQLISVNSTTVSGTVNRTYTYDNFGNRTKLVENRGGTVIEENYFCDAANQLYQITRSDGSVTALVHDNNGNMTSMVTQVGGTVTENMAYTYDFDDRLVRVENRLEWPKPVVEYGYDPLGVTVSSPPPS